MAKIRIAIVGAGNCASSLIQGMEFYRRAKSRDPIPGLMHLELGGYHIGDTVVKGSYHGINVSFGMCIGHKTRETVQHVNSPQAHQCKQQLAVRDII